MNHLTHTKRLRLPISLLTFLLFSCASQAAMQVTMQPFSTDGCSLFPDRSLVNQADWCSCCMAHDFAYWRGGPSEARLKADQELKACVLKASGDSALAELMFAGVRAGGGPYFYTPYRWGYGWPYGHAYKQLTAEEDALASSLESEYRAKNTPLVCPSKLPASK